MLGDAGRSEGGKPPVGGDDDLARRRFLGNPLEGFGIRRRRLLTEDCVPSKLSVHQRRVSWLLMLAYVRYMFSFRLAVLAARIAILGGRIEGIPYGSLEQPNSSHLPLSSMMDSR
jgi:hypothetical protein